MYFFQKYFQTTEHIYISVSTILRWPPLLSFKWAPLWCMVDLAFIRARSIVLPDGPNTPATHCHTRETLWMTHSMNKPPYKMLHASTFQASVDFLIDLAVTPPLLTRCGQVSWNGFDFRLNISWIFYWVWCLI